LLAAVMCHHVTLLYSLVSGCDVSSRYVVIFTC